MYTSEEARVWGSAAALGKGVYTRLMDRVELTPGGKERREVSGMLQEVAFQATNTPGVETSSPPPGADTRHSRCGEFTAPQLGTTTVTEVVVALEAIKPPATVEGIVGERRAVTAGRYVTPPGTGSQGPPEMDTARSFTPTSRRAGEGPHTSTATASAPELLA
jgi:hypothetical protein